MACEKGRRLITGFVFQKKKTFRSRFFLFRQIHDFSMFRHPGEEGHTLAWLVEWENFSLARSSWIVDEELESVRS